MSIIIPEVDLPSDGETITIDVCSCGIAWVSNKGEWDKHQAIQIPKNHGRLIDADAVIDQEDCYWETEQDLKCAPTILEAEEE